MNFIRRFTLPAIVGLPVILGILLLILPFRKTSDASRGISFKKIAVVYVDGAIFDAEAIVNKLNDLVDDNMVAGVLLRVNSPGGATAPSQEIYQAVRQFRMKNKPLVVSMGSIAASGGYYIACPAQWIFADPGTLTGSIGVIMTLPLYKELAEKIGIEMRTYKSGKYKDIANAYRTMSAEENTMIQNLLDDTHDQFIDDVANSRNIDRDSLLLIADGRIFTGRQAKVNKLVDSLGTFEDALHYLKTITKLGANGRVINKKDPGERMQRWIIREMVHLFPHLYRVIAPTGMHCLFLFE